MQAKLALLQTELSNIDLAAHHLAYSLKRCADSDAWITPTEEQLERLESMAARFARLSDLLIQRIFRLIDELELVGSGTTLDRIYRAEKRGCGSSDQLIKIRELRNVVAHEYAIDSMPDIYRAIIELSPQLLQSAALAKDHALILLEKRQNPQT